MAECEEQSAVVCTCEWKGVIGMDGMCFNAVQFALCIGPHHKTASEKKMPRMRESIVLFLAARQLSLGIERADNGQTKYNYQTKVFCCEFFSSSRVFLAIRRYHA